MDKLKSGRFLLIITIAIYVAFGLVTSVIGVIIDKFQVQYNVSLNIAALLPFAFLSFIWIIFRAIWCSDGSYWSKDCFDTSHGTYDSGMLFFIPEQ